MPTELSWPGKRAPAAPVPAHPPLLETFEPHRVLHGESADQALNALYFGNNLGIMAHLLAQGYGGQVRLIYADPPYDSGVNWVRKVRLRRPRQRGVDPVIMQQVQYADTWLEGEYLQFIYERLSLMRQLLANDGSLWLHCDYRRAHHLRCLLDEVFGVENYLNTITWRSQTARGAKVNAFYFPNSTHSILIYARNRTAPTKWNAPRKRLQMSEREAAQAFMRDERGFFRTSDPGAYTFDSLKRLFAEGRLYAPYDGTVVVDEAARRVYASNGGNLGVKYYLTSLSAGQYQVERAVDNLWDDVPGLGTKPGEDLGYPTQKTEALLERIITSGTDPGDLVLDPFCGAGAAPAVAEKLGRRWIACDASYGAIQTTVRRMQAVIDANAARSESPCPGFACYGVRPPAQTNTDAALNTRLSITRISDEPATIELVVEEVETPLLAGIIEPEPEWRARVDSIAVDPAFDGETFRATLADVPMKKRAVVAGCYRVELPLLPTTVAVRIVDIAGGEQLVTYTIER